MLYAVCKLYRVCDLEEHDCVDLHGNVILGDNCLGLEVNHLFLNGDPFCHTVDKRYQEVDAGAPRFIECTQTLDNVDVCLGNDADTGNQYQHDKYKYC